MSKLVKSDFLPLLICDLQDGMHLSSICEKYEKTKQAINYYIRYLKDIKAIEQTQTQPYALFKITPYGEAVKRILTQSHNERPKLWKAHNLIVGFNIVSSGSFNFIENKNRKIVQMNNWSYAREEINFGNKCYIINIQDTGLFKIYCPEDYTNEPDISFGKMYADAQKIAQLYVDKYDMKLLPIKTIRKGEKSLVSSERLSKLLGRTKTDNIFVNASDGTEELEEPQDSYAIEDLLKMPKTLSEMQETQRIFIESLKAYNEQNAIFARNLKSHLAAIQELRDAVRELRDEIRK